MAEKNIQRLTDPNTAGAPVTSTSCQVTFACNLLVATDGDPVAGHGTGIHAAPVTANGSDLVWAEGERVNRLGDPDSCGHPRADIRCTCFVGP